MLSIITEKGFNQKKIITITMIIITTITITIDINQRVGAGIFIARAQGHGTDAADLDATGTNQPADARLGAATELPDGGGRGKPLLEMNNG